MTPSFPARRRSAFRSPRFSIKPICFAACLAAQSLAMALPQGATPAFGQTQVRQTATGQLAITQTTGKAGIDWQSFSIGSGERVVIQQPNASSVLLNRVTGYDPSLILGQMQSNGRVFLTNPRGVIFGSGSQVDVGGLVATTLGISNEAVQSGRYQLLTGSSAPGSIVAGGSIRASGTVALVAPVVEQTGSIVAGRVGLAAASSVLVDVDGDGLIFFDARNDGLDARLSMLGNIQAQGGTADIRAVARSGFADTVLNLDGVVQARGLTAKGGKVIIDGGPAGVTRVSGQVSADGASGGAGGEVQVLGHQVLIDKTAVLSANGETAGGSVLVGGDYQGKNADLRNAADVIVQQGAKLSANATERGDGGKVVVWSDGTTLFDGAITARGGPLGGNGGLVETSGKQNLGISTGSVDAGAVSGQAGTWLLDPSDLTIDESVSPGEAYPGVNGLLGVRTIKPSVLNAAGTAISLTATNNIVVAAGSPVALTTAAAGLTLNASNQIILDAGLSTNNGAISLTSGAGGISLATGQSINAGNSTIALNTGTGNATLNGSLATTNATGAAIAVTNAANLQIGNISTGAAGTTTLAFTGAGAQVAGTSISAGSLVKQGGTGVLTLTGANPYTGTTTVSSGTLVVSGATATAGTGAMTLAAGTTLQIGNGATLGNSAITTGAGTIVSANSGTGTITGGITLNGATSFDATASTDQLNLDGPIGGGAANTLIKTGAGTVTLAGANTYAGNTNLNAGTLQVSGAGGNAGTGALALAAGTTLDITGGANVGNATLASADATISSVAGNGTLSSAAITLTGANTFSSGDPANGLVVSGVIGGAVGLTKAGVGLVTFRGANNYTGTTAITAGTLRADGAGAKLGANTANVTLASVATLDIIGGANVTNAGVASAGGTISSSTGAGTLTAPTLMSGTTTLSAGDIAAGLNIVGVISGAVGNGITKSGVGRVTLSQATTNTYSGDTTVNAGLLQLGADNVLPDAGALTVSGATTVFDLNGHTDTVGAVRLVSGSIADVAGGGSLVGASYAVESGSIGASLGNASADLTKTTGGTVTMTGTNSYRNTTIGDGTLRLGGATATAGTGTIALTTNTAVLDVSNGASVANAITSAGGTVGNSAGLGTLTAANSMTLSADSVLSSTLAGGGNGLTVAKSIGGGFGVTKTGAGTVTLSGTNSYGGTTVSDGRLSLGAANSLPNSTLTIDGAGAILDLNGQSASTGAVTLVAGSIVNGGAAAALTGTSYDVRSGTISAVLAGASADLTKSTNGTVVLSGANTYRNTIVGAGTLQLGADNVLPDAGALTVSGATTVFDLNGHTDTVGAVRLVSGSIADVAGGGSLIGASYAVESGSIGASLGNASADLTKTTGGTVTMTGTNSYRNTTIGDGTLRLGGATATAGTGTIALTTNTAVLDVSNGASVANAITSAGGTVGNSAGLGTLTAANSLTLSADSVLSSTLAGGGNGLTVAKSIGGGFGVTKTGAGTVTLSGTNSYSGTTVSDGRLSLGAANSLPNSTLTIDGAGAILDLNGQSASTGAVTLVAGSIVNGGAAAALTGTSYDVRSGTISAVLAGASADLTKSTNGTVVLSGANTYRNTIVGAGTLQLGADNVLPDAGALTVSGATTVFDLNGHTDTVGAVRLVSGSIADVAGGGSLVGASYAVESGSIGASLGNASADLTKTTGGTVTMTGTNSYRNTTIGDGTLRLGADNVLSAGTLTVSGANATFDLNGHTDAVGFVSLVDGSIADTAGTPGSLTGTDFAVQSGTVGAILTGGAGVGLSKTTTGTVTLSAANSYLGNTGIVASGGTLRVAGNGKLGADAGAVALGSGATLDIVGGADVSNTSFTSNGGTISTSTGTGTLSSAAITLAATTTLNAATTGDTLTVSGTMGGAAGANVSKTGQGTVVISRANTYAGSTDISAGTLQAAGTLAKLGSGVITLGSNSTLDIVGGAILSNPTLNSAGGTIASSSGGGTLQSAVALGAASTTTLSAADTVTGLTLSGPISGATGGIAKQGGGLATLSSAGNNYGGVTTVANGTLATSAAERLPDAGSVVVDSTGILRLGGNETIGSLTLSGTLDGTLAADTLTAASYALSGGTANANLGAGTLTSTGASALNGSAATASVDVNAGTLTLGSADRLANAATVSVASLATLKLNGNDTIANLALAGTLAGTASTDRLTAATQTTLTSGSVGAALTTPLLTSSGNSTIVADVVATTSATVNAGTLTLGATGTLSAPSIFVVGGTLATSAADRIGNASSLVVATGATLALGGSDIVTSLDLSGNLLASGTDRLTASTSASLNGGDVHGNLTTPLLTSTGNSQIAADVRADTRATVATGTTTITATGSLTAPTVRVDGGATLATETNERIGNTSNLDVATSGTLQLGGFETVSALSLGGRITGPGSLRTNGGTNLTDGTLDSPLTTTTLTSVGTSSIGAAITATASATVQSGSLTINAGSLDSPLIDVQAGSLITTANGQFGSSPEVHVAPGASLQLAGAESIGAFTLLGSLNGTGHLQATSASLDGGTVNTTLGTTTLTSTGASTLHAATSVTGTATVTGGTLTVAADGSLAATIVAVQGGTLATAADERIADSAALQVGNGGTLSLGGSETVASLADLAGQTADGSAAVQLGTHALTVRNLAPTTDTSFGGIISGTGADALLKDGLGTLRLSGANTYTGTTIIDAGTLATIGNERLADAGTVQIANGASFALGGNETLAAIGDKAGQTPTLDSAQIHLGTHLLTVANTDAATDTTFSGTISSSGAGALTKAGAGTLRLAGANTYTGTTLVAAGTLATVGNERLADATAVQVANDATLQLGGNETVASIADPTGQTGASTAAIALGANTLTVKSLAAATDTTFSGVISGTGSNGLTKDGAGSLRLAGANTYVGITLVEAGTLMTVGDESLPDAGDVQIANGATLKIGGNETVASIADKAGQTPNGSAMIDVAASLTAGSAADTLFSGSLTGAGALAKSGTGTLILAGNNSYAGTTTIAGGVLQIGNGGTTGSLGTGAVIDNASLRFVRSDSVPVANAIGGSGALEQAGSGTLTLSSPLNSYSGSTTITSGTLATAGSNQLPDASALIVKPAAALVLGGDETVDSIQSEGQVTLNGSVTTAGDQRYVGAVNVATTLPITLTALNLSAVNAGNTWGTQPLSLNIGNELKLSAGTTTTGAFNDLTLGSVSVGGGASTLEAGLLALSGDFALLGGTFTLTANAAPASYALVVEEGKLPGSILGPDGRTPLAEASDVITQTGGAITTVANSSLAFVAPNKGSMTFSNEANNFLGAFSAVSGTAGTAWAALPATVSGAPANVPGGAVDGLSRITVAGNAIHVGPDAKVANSGLEADLVRISANTLATDNGGTIVARLPYNDGLGGGTNASTPGLRITLLPGAFGLTEPFGNDTVGIATRIGDLSGAPIAGIFSAGFMQVLPLAGRQGGTAVFLTGPEVTLSANGYRFFNDGAAVLTEIPVYYNGFAPDTPQKSGALSAAASVSEEARRQRFEEAVRTENVAVRLRSGVIAEVGPGRPATVGSDGVKPPAICSPKEGELQCGDAPPKAKVSSVMGALRKVVAR